MADLSDVETALVAAIVQAATSGGEGACPALGGYALRVYRGTPPTAVLTQDRSAGVVDVCVFPVPDATRNTTRWGTQNFITGITSGLSHSVSGQTATFSGIAVAGELAGLLVNDLPFVYRAAAGDNAALVAAALADQVRVTQVCWLQNASVTIPGAVTLVARNAGVASVLQEWARQTQDLRISVWAPSPAARDAICGPLSATLAQISFLLLADGSSGRLIYRKTASFDDDQVASIYRRDLIFEVEYATTVSLDASTMLFGEAGYNGTDTYT